MMSQPIGIKIFKKFVNTIEKGQKTQIVPRRTWKLAEHGEQRIYEDKWLTLESLEPSEVESWFDSLVADAQKQNLLHIMKITTSLLTLCGFVNLVISNDIKK